MFVSNGQFFVFMACVAFGGVGGLCFLPFRFIKIFVKNKIASNIFDFISLIFITILFILFCVAHKLPNLRAYMIIGVFIGLFAYFKSFNLILANLEKKIYNKYINYKGRKDNGRTKDKKSA